MPDPFTYAQIAAALGQSVLGAQAKSSQTAQQYADLLERQRQAREQEQLAKATRSDAFGNRIEFDPGINAFSNKITPFTKAILDAQQKEQLDQFTLDAPRQRASAIRTDRRAKQAGEIADDRLNELQYGRRRSDKENIAASVRQAAVDNIARRNSTDADALSKISNLALRTGNRASLPGLLQTSRAQSDEQDVQNIARARSQGGNENISREDADRQRQLQELSNVTAIANANPSTPQGLDRSNVNNALSGRQDHALGQLLATREQGNQSINQARGALSASAGQSGVDLSSLVSSLGSAADRSQRNTHLDKRLAHQTEQGKLSRAASRANAAASRGAASRNLAARLAHQAEQGRLTRGHQSGLQTERLSAAAELALAKRIADASRLDRQESGKNERLGKQLRSAEGIASERELGRNVRQDHELTSKETQGAANRAQAVVEALRREEGLDRRQNKRISSEESRAAANLKQKDIHLDKRIKANINRDVFSAATHSINARADRVLKKEIATARAQAARTKSQEDRNFSIDRSLASFSGRLSGQGIAVGSKDHINAMQAFRDALLPYHSRYGNPENNLEGN